MNKVKVILTIALLMTTLGVPHIFKFDPLYRISEASPTQISKLRSNQYEIHNPINITSDIDFIELGFPGNGTPESPYIIEKFAITGSKIINKLINIENVTSHFIIQNNNLYGNESAVFDQFVGNYDAIQKIINIKNVYSPFIIKGNYILSNGSDAIKLENSNNGAIENNTIESAQYAINILFSHTSISNNRITNSFFGIRLIGSPGSEILNNTIYGGPGIFVYSDDVRISYNIISSTISVGISVINDLETNSGLIVTYNYINNTGTGIAGTVYNSVFSNNKIHNSKGNALMISASSSRIASEEENIISHNLISDTTLYGIVIDESSKNKISNNEILYSGYSGISISGDFFTGYNLMANHNIFEYNSIHYSKDYAVRIGQHSINNSFYNNNFLQNGNGEVQAYDESKFNTFEFNYWDDWLQPDADGNGIIDQPYEFDDNSDKYPLIEPNSGEAFRPIQTQEIVQTRSENVIVITETIVHINTVINKKSYDITGITLFVVFSIIGIISILGKNPVFNRIRVKLKDLRRETRDLNNITRSTDIQNMNLDIHCGSCGMINPPQSSFCIECGVFQNT